MIRNGCRDRMPCNVSIVKRALVKKELIEIEKRKVIIPDPVMKVWLKKELGGV